MIELEHLVGQTVLSQGVAVSAEGALLYVCGANILQGSLHSDRQAAVRPLHDAPVSCLALSHSGRLVASAQEGENSNVYVWDLSTQQVLHSLEEHDVRVQAVAFSHDDRLLLTLGAEDDGKLIAWDTSNGCIVSSNGRVTSGTASLAHGGFVRDVKRRDTHRYQFACGGKAGVELWELDPHSGHMQGAPAVAEARSTTARHVTALCYSLDRERVLAATSSGDFLVVAVKTKRIVAAIAVTKASLDSILALKHGLVVGCGDGTVRFFDHNCEQKSSFALPHLSPAVQLVSRNSTEAVALTRDGSLVRIGLGGWDTVVLAEAHTDGVVAVTFADDRSDRFATASSDGTVKVWDLSDYRVVATATARRGQARGATPLCLVFAMMLVSGWSDGFILSHDSETGEAHWFIDNAHADGVTALALSHNTKFLLSGGACGEVRMWELRSRELISHLKDHTQRVTGIALLDDDCGAVSCSRDRSIARWDLTTERRAHSMQQRMGGINGLALSKDGLTTVSVGQDRRLVFWDNCLDHAPANATSVLRQHYLDGELDEGIAVAISHSGLFVATGGTAGVIRIWAYASGALLCEGRAHNAIVTGLSFSPNDKLLVSSAVDGAIAVWYLALEEASPAHYAPLELSQPRR